MLFKELIKGGYNERIEMTDKEALKLEILRINREYWYLFGKSKWWNE